MYRQSNFSYSENFRYKITRWQKEKGRGGKREGRGIENERKTCRVSCSVMAWYIVQLHALGRLAELNVIYRRDRSFERWTVCFESPGKLLDTWQLRLLWARPEAKLTSARTGKDKVVKRYDSLLSRLSLRATRNNSRAINPLINEILPQVFFCVFRVSTSHVYTNILNYFVGYKKYIHFSKIMHRNLI